MKSAYQTLEDEAKDRLESEMHWSRAAVRRGAWDHWRRQKLLERGDAIE